MLVFAVLITFVGRRRSGGLRFSFFLGGGGTGVATLSSGGTQNKNFRAELPGM